MRNKPVDTVHGAPDESRLKQLSVNADVFEQKAAHACVRVWWSGLIYPTGSTYLIRLKKKGVIFSQQINQSAFVFFLKPNTSSLVRPHFTVWRLYALNGPGIFRILRESHEISQIAP